MNVNTISGLSFARLSHLLSNHDGMVLCWWLPCWLPTLMIVKCLMCMLDSSRLASW